MFEFADEVVRRAGESELTALIECDPFAQADESRRNALNTWLLQGVVLVAQVQGEVVGLLVLEHGLFGHGFIPLICVKPSARRRRHALRLIRAAEAECRTPRLFTSANASNTQAQALLARAGFARSGTIENLDAGDPELVYFKPVVSEDGG
jgi:ribosomal protein S18 acetylase RimI-like enzyme